MSLKSILVGCVLLGSSTAALAAPGHGRVDVRPARVETVRPVARPVAVRAPTPQVRDHRDSDRFRAPARETFARERPIVVRERPTYIHERPIVVREPVYVNNYAYTTPIDLPVYTAPAYTQPLISLASSASLANGQLDLETYGRLGSASTLQLSATSGSTYVGSVTLRYADGTAQTIAIDRTLDPSCALADVSISSAVTSIAIAGSSDAYGALSVTAL